MIKKISFILMFIMLFTIIPHSTFAMQDYDKQLEEVILRSKELFDIGDEYDKFTHSISTHYGNTIFYLNWSDSNGELGSIDVSMTIDGTVISYGKWIPYSNRERSKIPTISKEEGLKIAKDFIKRASPKYINNIKYIDREGPLNVNSDSHDYYFIRVENGVPYYSNSIDIYIDNSTGEVRNYYTNWDLRLFFTGKEDIITIEKAQDLYKEKISLDLIYRIKYEEDLRNPYLIYGPLNTNLGINAKDGDVINFYNDVIMKDKALGGAGDTIEAELSPDEREAVEGITGLISQEEAEAIGRDILELDSDYNLESINLYRNWRNDNSYSWQMYFVKELDSNYYSASIRIDAKTEELFNFYKYNPIDPNKEAQYDKDESLEIAKECIMNMNPDKFELIELNEDYNENEAERPKSYYFNFIRKVDNAYVQSDNIQITVDAVEGKIQEYWINWSNMDFPSQENVIPIDRAYDILFKDIGLELKYINPNRYSPNTEEKKEAILVYGLKTDKPANIDANVGTILNNNGDPYKESVIISYKDIENSYAKEKINVLAQYGIALLGEEFKPKEKINQRDYLYLLAKAENPYFELNESKDNLYPYLINLGIVKEKEKAPEKIVTKEEGIKYIIRALKYDKVGDLNGIYKDIFKDTNDIEPDLKGYVAIACGLNIVEGSNGYLHPKAELKREDAANMIYNYVFNGN